ncbi:Aste57867_11909 [Aphanomyces stellatus]|uniref:Aste57867_11909 protein n=1 Tax=Aphanomyces stellatus TaxID=120398 RepID=A0A485KUP3_9STRA|nr:hypothetical protein As57867_011864 [Aphanomyces stellatus]VFT88764.1 Aste57867_11909 [Aphanomyces stellatus]
MLDALLKCNWDSIIAAQDAAEKPRTVTQDDAGVLHMRGKIWIPDKAHELLTRIIIVAHCGSLGHRGQRAMLHLIRRHFITTDLETKSSAFLKSCLLCPHIRGGKIVQRPQGDTWSAERRNEGLQFDFLYMGDAWDGSKYVLVLKDDLTHFVKLIACDSPTSQVAVDAYMEWSALFSVPRVWISDGGSHFKNNIMTDLATRLKVKHNIVLAYCPWRNSTVKRMQAQTDVVGLHSVCLQANLNSTPTKFSGGMFPMYAFVGIEPTTPLDVVVGNVNKRLNAAGYTSIDFEKKSLQCAMDYLRESLHEIHTNILDKSELQEIVNCWRTREAKVRNRRRRLRSLVTRRPKGLLPEAHSYLDWTLLRREMLRVLLHSTPLAPQVYST